ncbi:transglutaminase-like domain-containing protein [Gimesia panareensis]|uniref:Transglutaminase-like superfamily protein n=1 Tax=Gimesia panareensis TaxID=2527978 RepID=A0A518A2V8_9PLAN|nr:transglutaminase domain-containing protein [Gimesia panareensis]QDT26153.1 Transglutaminase-like superfamily protein [Gimesia panareensis]QDU49082.1 Transglutaminase-like superfamily protein [Gimesia panareensis]
MNQKHYRLQTVCTLIAMLAALFMLLFFQSFPLHAEDEQQTPLKPDLPYQAEKSDPINHEVQFSVVVTPPYHCKVLKVWIPVPQTDAAQEIKASEFSTFPQEVTPRISNEPVYGNRFAYFEFHNPHGAQIITHRFKAKVWNLRWHMDPAKVAKVDHWPKSFAPYLKPQSVEQPQQFRQVIQNISTGFQNKGPGLIGAMNWIDQNLTYDHVNASLRADANHAFAQRRGHCSDYHGLCATMGRALGYPTRVTYGLALYPKNSPSHCKMEAYLPPYGWISFDLSETQKLAKRIQSDEDLTAEQKATLNKAVRQRTLSGFRENSWLLLTRGTDYQLSPPASQPVRVVRTAYVEADGEVLPDPDPANINKREFSWMTSHRYTADRPFKKPFKDLSTLSED